MGSVVAILVLVALAVLLVYLLRVRSRAMRTFEADARASGPKASAPASVRGPTGLGSRLQGLLGRVPGDEEWQRLEETLIRADVGGMGAVDLVARVRARFDPDGDPAELLREEIVNILGPDEGLALAGDRLAVVLVVGVNGSGKTTTIGKLAHMLAGQDKTVMLAASDTYRAAAGEQIDVWASRSGAQVVSQERGADPGSVTFDAVRAAAARGADVLLVDTAGRLHTRAPLMDELAKVKRVVAKAGGTVDETLLVLDATTGQNGIAQGRAFTDAVAVTGLVITKMDGTARGGVVLAVREELGVPVKLIGVGEGLGDLRAFSAERFAEGMLAGP
jgi:fused signal recognition particle receptor